MATAKELYARSILLEQFENGMNIKKALERVIAEIGPNAMKKRKAVEWYKHFETGNLEIADDASEEDQTIIKNGNYLKFQRSLICKRKLSSKNRKLTNYGTDGRYFLYYSPTLCCYAVFDVFHGTKRELKFDWSAITTKNDRRILVNVYFLDNGRVLVAMCNMYNSTQMFLGTFNFADATLKYERMLEISSIGNRRYMDNQPSLLWCNWKFNLKMFANINIEDLSLENTSVIRHDSTKHPLSLQIREGENWIGRLGFPVLRDDKLCRFKYGAGKKLVETSIVDGTKKELAVENENRLKLKRCKLFQHWYAGDKLFVVPNCTDNNSIAIVHEFNYRTLKWSQTNMNVPAVLDGIFVANDCLFAFFIDQKNGKGLRAICKFRLSDRTDSLSNLVWDSMRRYSRFNPGFYQWFSRKLPHTSKFRSLW
ncbi:hypothetical protein M3Y95_01054100 [Aphelenchoides besseyi]|nr:hypothetical protein M3Y95_01054100 [Aphelenchoides besseyi]